MLRKVFDLFFNLLLQVKSLTLSVYDLCQLSPRHDCISEEHNLLVQLNPQYLPVFHFNLVQ